MNNLSLRLLNLAADNALKLGTLLLVAFFALKIPSLFLSLANAKQIALAGAILLIVGCPAAILILMGHVDLSVGAMLGLGGVLCGELIVNGCPWVLAAVITIAVGACVGGLNAWLCVRMGLSPIIVTIGGLTALRGVAQLIVSSPPTGFGNGMAFLGRGEIAGIPVSVWIAVAIFVASLLFVVYSPYGRHVYAIGVNLEAAYLSGVRVRALPSLAYIVSGAAAALGGVLFAGRLDSAPPASLGVGFEFDVLTAVLLGGIAFTGGRGKISGVLTGVIFLGVLQNGMLLMNLSAYWQGLASGIALVAAAGLDRFSLRVNVAQRDTQELVNAIAATTAIDRDI